MSNNECGNIYDSNNNKHQLYHEFLAFTKIIHERDYKTVQRMLEITEITMNIQTEARRKAGVIFPADNK
ncbi:hypothetical protein [Oceanobacillus oncorhynchi]|uniref:hypothetical protein n=1 Tax=Oceanobacillus oncorhynchi TaxID=545501 RepID=UPI0031D39A05